MQKKTTSKPNWSRICKMKQKNEKLKKNQKPFSCSQIHEKISSTLNDNALMIGKAPPPHPLDLLSNEINETKSGSKKLGALINRQ